MNLFNQFRETIFENIRSEIISLNYKGLFLEELLNNIFSLKQLYKPKYINDLAKYYFYLTF